MAKTDEFDFGFSHVDEKEITKIADTRLRQMYDAIMPLLNNLKANPDKDTIKWPNRTAKIDEFILKLQGIMNGT